MAVTSVASLRRCPTSPESVPHFSGIRNGFRGLAFIENGTATLVSRKSNVYKTFGLLSQELARSLHVRDAVIDGEIVHLGPDGLVSAALRPVHFGATEPLPAGALRIQASALSESWSSVSIWNQLLAPAKYFHAAEFSSSFLVSVKVAVTLSLATSVRYGVPEGPIGQDGTVQ